MSPLFPTNSTFAVVRAFSSASPKPPSKWYLCFRQWSNTDVPNKHLWGCVHPVFFIGSLIFQLMFNPFTHPLRSETYSFSFTLHSLMAHVKGRDRVFTLHLNFYIKTQLWFQPRDSNWCLRSHVKCRIHMYINMITITLKGFFQVGFSVVHPGL